jgi:hypothetical protein
VERWLTLQATVLAADGLLDRSKDHHAGFRSTRFDEYLRAKTGDDPVGVQIGGLRTLARPKLDLWVAQ